MNNTSRVVTVSLGLAGLLVLGGACGKTVAPTVKKETAKSGSALAAAQTGTFRGKLESLVFNEAFVLPKFGPAEENPYGTPGAYASDQSIVQMLKQIDGAYTIVQSYNVDYVHANTPNGFRVVQSFVAFPSAAASRQRFDLDKSALEAYGGTNINYFQELLPQTFSDLDLEHYYLHIPGEEGNTDRLTINLLNSNVVVSLGFILPNGTPVEDVLAMVKSWQTVFDGYQLGTVDDVIAENASGV